MAAAQPLPDQWARAFGLAESPLFVEQRDDGFHTVLLDGGYGSFALSVTDEEIWRSPDVRSWAWSSNLPHHVTATPTVIAVNRWDRREAEEFQRSTVEENLQTFYKYLVTDRVASTKRVVEHVVLAFRKLRSLVGDASVPDNQSIDAFLALLARSLTASSSDGAFGQSLEVPQGGPEALAELSAAAVDKVLSDLRSNSNSPGLNLLPELAIRHAGSEIFQEAHFELVRTSAPDLFDDVAPAKSRPLTRSGSHFTPPALARAVTEQTLAQLTDLPTRSHLTVLDPACGSGAFLQEAIHELQRRGFQGRLTLVGRDVSPAAVSMARFALSVLRREWRGPAFTLDLAVGDSLRGDLPSADAILMNPPFQSWSALTNDQRELMSKILGPTMAGRADYSMAFVSRMSSALTEGGALGTLVPASLLNLQAAAQWREALLAALDLRLIASLGDYNLFANAMVQIAALVFRKPLSGERRSVDAVALTAANDVMATGDALRALRRSDIGEETADWQTFRIDLATLRRRSVWRLTSPSVQRTIARIAEIGGIVRLDTVFNVRQGIRTGSNKIFLLDQWQLQSLPTRERVWFRPAIMNESIWDGDIKETHWIFYPYNSAGLAIESEAQLEKLLPAYLQRWLQPNRAELEKRANIRDSQARWWELSVKRSWSLESGPRIVSKYFGSSGGFALDPDGRFAVVQGFAWFPAAFADLDDELQFPLMDILRCYAAIFNSREFESLLELFCPQVAGGQFDLSPRYVDDMPLPNLFDLAGEGVAGERLRRLTQLGEALHPSDPAWQNEVNAVVRELYGGGITQP